MSVPSVEREWRFKPSSFVSHTLFNCIRKLSLDAELAPESRRTDAPPTPTLGAQHTSRGLAFEALVVEFERSRGLIIDYPESPLGETTVTPSAAAQALRALVLGVPDGETRLISQALIVVPDALQALLRTSCAAAAPKEEQLVFGRTFPDLLKVTVSADGTVRDITVIDIKSSSKAKVGHRMQIAFYAMCLEVIFAPQSSCHAEDSRAVNISPFGEVWLPKDSTEGVDGDDGSSTTAAYGPYRIEEFSIQKKLVTDYFARDLPKAMRGDAEWEFQPSCHGCPHLTRCKADLAESVKKATATQKGSEGEDPQRKAIRTGRVCERSCEPLRLAHAPRDLNKSVAVVVTTSSASSATAATFLSAFVAHRPIPGTAEELAAASVAASNGLLPSDGLVTAEIKTSAELIEVLWSLVVERSGDVIVWDDAQRSLLLEVLKRAGDGGPGGIDSRRMELLQLLWEDFDSVRLEPSVDEPGGLHYLSRRCYAVKDVLERLYCLPFPGPVVFEEARMLFRPSKWFPTLPAGVFDAYAALEFTKLPINACFLDLFLPGSAHSNSTSAVVMTSLALTSDLWNLLGLALEQPFAKRLIRPYPLKNRPTQPIPQQISLARSSSSTQVEEIAALQKFVARHTIYSSCCKVTETWRENDDPIKLVYAPLPSHILRPLSDDLKQGLCRFRVAWPADASRISPSGLAASTQAVETGDANQEDGDDASGLQQDLEAMSLTGRQPSSKYPTKCSGCKATHPIDAFKLVQRGDGVGAGLWSCACPVCGAMTDVDQSVESAKAKFGDFVLSTAFIAPGRDETDCCQLTVSRGQCLRDVCDVLAVGLDDSDGQWYVYISRAFVLAKQGNFAVNGGVFYLLKRHVDFNTRVLRDYIADDASSRVLKTPLLQMVAAGGAAPGGTPCTTNEQAGHRDEGLENAKLSFEQAEAIRHSLGPSPLTILWGPPGTGKTSTLGVMLSLWLRKHPQLRVLVVATTKDALQEVAKALRRHNAPLEVIDSYSKLSARGKRNFQQAKGTISLATVWQAAKLLKEEAFVPFDALVIDEASQMTVAQALVASLLLSPEPGKFKIVVAGDLLQLPPIQEDVTHWLPKGCIDAIYSARHSIMQAVMSTTTGGRLRHAFGAGRADQEWLNVVQLRKSFRSVKQIVEFVGASYPAGMEAHKGAGDEVPLRTMCLPAGSDRAAEAESITALLSNLFSSRRAAEPQVTVVCTHRLQRYALRSRIQKMPWAQFVVVETTEKTQGSEADVVVIAFAGGVNYGSTFPFDFNRLNVAISRAREQVVLVINQDFPHDVVPNEQFPDARHASAAEGLRLLQRFVTTSVRDF